MLLRYRVGLVTTSFSFRNRREGAPGPQLTSVSVAGEASGEGCVSRRGRAQKPREWTGRGGSARLVDS